MQLIRLMGMTDKVIAFDELPMELLEGLEMRKQDFLPRHWRDFLGTREKVINMPPYLDPMTRQMVKCDPIVEKAPFAWIVDWEVNQDKDRWQEISNYVRRNAPKDFRLLDKIEDMAKPMGQTVQGELTLEPEDVPIIPLPKAVKEETSSITTILKEAAQIVTQTEIVPEKAISAPNPESPKAENGQIKQKEHSTDKACEVCGKVLKHGKGMFFHMKKHKKVAVPA